MARSTTSWFYDFSLSYFAKSLRDKLDDMLIVCIIILLLGG